MIDDLDHYICIKDLLAKYGQEGCLCYRCQKRVAEEVTPVIEDLEKKLREVEVE